MNQIDNIMEGHKYNQSKHQNKTGKMNISLVFGIDAAADNQLDQQENQSSPIQRRNRKKIEDADIDGNKSKEVHDRRKPGLACLTDRLRQSPLWANLLIVLLPDHGIGYPEGLTDLDPRRAHIPLILCGGAVREHRTVDVLCNQSDLAATLLGQLGLAHDDFRFSRDVLSATYRHPSAVHVWSEGLWHLDATGLSAVSTQQADAAPLREEPQPSEARRRAAKAYLQTAYDDLAARDAALHNRQAGAH